MGKNHLPARVADPDSRAIARPGFTGAQALATFTADFQSAQRTIAETLKQAHALERQVAPGSDLRQHLDQVRTAYLRSMGEVLDWEAAELRAVMRQAPRSLQE